MNETELRNLIDLCVAGDISPDQHERLQAELKSNPQARAALREQLDVEAALRTWAAESVDVRSTKAAPERSFRRATGDFHRLRMMLAIAASVALISVGWWVWTSRHQPQQIANLPSDPGDSRVVYVGTIGTQNDCVWRSESAAIAGGRFSAQKLSLTSGVAELKFDSGTNVILQGPCDFEVLDGDAAWLLAGSVVVHVTELSDGFTLNTPEATILDDGTEYAVSLDADATELHVFEGAVVWEPKSGSEKSGNETIGTERIESGEARRYSRLQPRRGARIPFGQRLFVRKIEAAVRDEAGQALLAYDGFENLAGRIQRDRSGFGWSGGWQSGRRGRGQLGEIVDAPSDVAFGIQRSGRRLLRLTGGDVLMRDFEKSLPLESGDAYYVSFLLKRSAANESPTNASDAFFELSLIDEGERTGRRSRKWFTFGISSARLPFIKSVGTISSSANAIENEATSLCVAKILVTHEQVITSLRVYDSRESIDSHEPLAWTVVGSTGPCDFRLSGVRLSAATAAAYDIDELKIGSSWASVTSATKIAP